MTPQELAQEVAKEGLKAAPPVAVSGAALFHGLSVPDMAQLIVLGLTAIYVILQAAYLLWKWRRDRAAVKPTVTVPPPK